MAVSSALERSLVLLVLLTLAFFFFGGNFVDTLRDWIARAHDESWPWNSVNSVVDQYKLHPTFLAAEALFIASALLAAWHAFTTDEKRSRGIGPQSLKLLWVLTFVAGTANDYIFMLMPMVDNFWQAQVL